MRFSRDAKTRDSKSMDAKKLGSLLSVAGLSAAMLCATVQTSVAGPLNLFRKGGGNQAEQAPQSGGNSGGFFGGLFGGGSRSAAPHGESHKSELPLGDPEVAMIVNPALGFPTLAKQNIGATKAAIQKYKVIVAQGGWPAIPAVAMKPGSRGPEIVTLHRRLEISGDLVGVSVPERYDAAVVAAVKRFQVRHGLPPTGVIDSKATIQAFNVPASVRLAQLQGSLKRLQKLAPRTGSRYVLVNVPAAQVEAVDGGRVAQRHTAVVGKIERPTPELSSKINRVKFNPYWHVPRSIIHKDLVPKGRKFASRGQDVLAAYRMEAFDKQGNQIDPRQINWFGEEVYNYNFRQQPWEENSLGFVKIDFPNKDAVYLHDTPLKSFFGKAIRFESSGCVRVHNVDQLVAWILRDKQDWNLSRIQSMKHNGQQVNVPSQSIPVHLAYISAWGTPDGQVQFRPDIYSHDSGGAYASAY